MELHSFRTLPTDLATLTQNRVQPKTPGCAHDAHAASAKSFRTPRPLTAPVVSRVALETSKCAADQGLTPTVLGNFGLKQAIAAAAGSALP